jgi:cytochrome c556
MSMRGFALGLVAIGCLSAVGDVAAEPIETRQTIMQSVGAAAKVSGGMAKGEIAFNPDVAMAALATFAAAGHSFASFFPEGSETGNDTEAKATIWEDMEGFIAASTKFADDASAAMAAKPADLDAFKAAFGSVAENCKACHEDYRVSRN